MHPKLDVIRVQDLNSSTQSIAQILHSRDGFSGPTYRCVQTEFIIGLV